MPSKKRANRSPLPPSSSQEGKRTNTGHDDKKAEAGDDPNKRTQHHGAVPMDSEVSGKTPTAATNLSLAGSKEPQGERAVGASLNAKVSEKSSDSTVKAVSTEAQITNNTNNNNNNKQTLISQYLDTPLKDATEHAAQQSSLAVAIAASNDGWTEVKKERKQSIDDKGTATPAQAPKPTRDRSASAGKSSKAPVSAIEVTATSNRSKSGGKGNSVSKPKSGLTIALKAARSAAIKAAPTKITKNFSAQFKDGSPTQVARAAGQQQVAAAPAADAAALPEAGRSRYKESGPSKVIGFGFEAINSRSGSQSGSSRASRDTSIRTGDDDSVSASVTVDDEKASAPSHAEMAAAVVTAQHARKELQKVQGTADSVYQEMMQDDDSAVLSGEEKIIDDMVNIANKFEESRKRGEDHSMEVDLPNGGVFQQIGTMKLPPTKNIVVHEVHNAILDEISNLPRKRKHVARFSLQLSISPSDDPEAEIHKAVVEVLNKFKSMDSKIVLYPYRASDCVGKAINPEIVDFDRFPKRFSAMRPYLYGLSDRFEQGTLYTSIYLAMEKKVDTFLTEASAWLRTTSHGGFYLHHVQAENMAVVGWLLYSMQTMDLARLQSELESKLCFAVQARYQIINTGRNKDLKDEDKIKAIHLRVDANLQDEALEMLGEIYSSSSKSFPLGHCMRMIPPVNKMMNPVNSNAFEELRYRQRSFQDSMTRILSYEVTTLFSDSHNVSLDLHDRLMGIQSPTFDGVPLFHCVDKPSPNAPVSLFCHPRDESFARSVTAGMVAYVRHFVRKDKHFEPYSTEENDYMARQVYRFFKTSAVKRSLGCEWCEETQGVISSSITNALDSLTADGRFDFKGTAAAGNSEGMVRAVDKKVQIIEPPKQYQTNEEDSIKTFREMTTGKRDARTEDGDGKKKSNLRASSPGPTDGSLGSKSATSSKGTRSSRSTKSSLTASDLTSVTMSVATLSSNVSSLQNQFEQMMKLFPVLAAQAAGNVQNLETPPTKTKRPVDLENDLTEDKFHDSRSNSGSPTHHSEATSEGSAP
jgi:hypothetical protein